MKRKTTFQSKLKSYSALAGSLIVAGTAADAQIVYTDIVDYTGTLNGDTYQLDLNNDGTTDFNISRLDTSFTVSYVGYTAKGVIGTKLNNNAIAVKGTGFYSTSALALQLNNVIGPAQIWTNSYTSGNLAAMAFLVAGSINAGPWVGVNDRYLGLRLENSGNIYYGWARVSVSANSQSFTIKDYAYRTSANTAINAGDKGSTTSIGEIGSDLTQVYASGRIITVNNTAPAAISIQNVLGQEVRSLNSSEKKTEIGMSDMPAGVYFVTVAGADSRTTTKVFIQ